jgi:hypothetical protein
MAADLSSPVHRLADQIHALSQVAETLTVRLLELEERLADQESRLIPALEAAAEADAAVIESMDLRLGDTEARLARLESLLRGEPMQRGETRLRAVPPISEAEPEALGLDEESDPFPEEGEQPFMDERIA